MILCPNCKALASYNSYFSRYLCSSCGWASESNRVLQDNSKETNSTNKDDKTLVLK